MEYLSLLATPQETSIHIRHHTSRIVAHKVIGSK
jgi:hypothetical protein